LENAVDLLAPELTADELMDSLDYTQKGQVANLIKNCKLIFQHDPFLKGAIRYNMLTERTDIVRDLGWKRTTSAVTDTDMKYLYLYFEENYGITSEKKIADALAIIANENHYHPIKDCLEALVWDKTPRIRNCLNHFLGAKADDYVEEMLKHFLLGAISRVFEAGCKYEEMLCLVGGQGAGKSTFFRLLAIRDEWFSDDLKKLDDDKVFTKLQGHWIIEMSEMLATSSAKSIEEVRSFISRQKETYRTPYESQPKDRLRQCVFGGTSNTLDFLPLDRAGNRRFLPVMVYPENAEVHILEDEESSREYILQVWAEAMEIYRSKDFSMRFSDPIQKQLIEVQKGFMPEDTDAGMIIGFLETYSGNMVCSKQLYREALQHEYDDPRRWQLHNINEIMNTVVKGWKSFSNPRMFPGYGRQKGWERIADSGNEQPGNEDGFVSVTAEGALQMKLPAEWVA
jgi:predicted P-loop ATPase